MMITADLHCPSFVCGMLFMIGRFLKKAKWYNLGQVRAM